MRWMQPSTNYTLPSFNPNVSNFILHTEKEKVLFPETRIKAPLKRHPHAFFHPSEPPLTLTHEISRSPPSAAADAEEAEIGCEIHSTTLKRARRAVASLVVQGGESTSFDVSLLVGRQAEGRSNCTVSLQRCWISSLSLFFFFEHSPTELKENTS